MKRKDSMMLRGEGDRLDVTPLGAGNEVGRSCVYMTYKGKTVLVSFQIFVFDGDLAVVVVVVLVLIT